MKVPKSAVGRSQHSSTMTSRDARREMNFGKMIFVYNPSKPTGAMTSPVDYIIDSFIRGEEEKGKQCCLA